MMKKVNKLITHNGAFHSDDIFAAATLSLWLEKNGEAFKIIRTRDLEIIKTGDYVFDVGLIYDEESNKFDHHQNGGAGKGFEDIEYASFGLVWKKFGTDLSGSTKASGLLEKKLVAPIDAVDNAIDLYKSNFEAVSPYTINDVMSTFSPTSLEDMNRDEQFLKAVDLAKEILTREIKKINDRIKIAEIIIDFYKNSPDKRLVVVDKPKVSRYEVWEALQDMPEPLYVIYGDKEDWAALAMRKDKNPGSFKNRKDFPKSWAGIKDEELQKITGVPDAVFCHRGLFLAVAKSKEGAVKLAQIAVES